MKIVTAFLKYDYGKKERGESGEKAIIFPSLQKTGNEVIPFWLEENGYPDNLDKLQENLMEFIDKEKPGILLFILMKDEIYPQTLEKLKDKTITINWFCDDQWRFENFTKYIAPKLTYSVTVDKFSLSKYKDINYKNVILSQWAVFDYVTDIEFDKINYKYDISFVGSRNPAREWIVSELKKDGHKVNCFGTGWPEGKVSYEEVKSIFLTSKINLNLSNSVPSDLGFVKHIIMSLIFSVAAFNLKKLKRTLAAAKLLISGDKRAEQIKARNFEIPGCGGFQLTQYAPQIEDHYDIGKEVVIFTNISDLKLQVKYYLSNENERMKICQKGYVRTKEYTYDNRFRKIFKEIKMK